MFENEKDSSFLIERVKIGKVVLILGAGATAGTTCRKNKQLLLGIGLAKALVEELGQVHAGESLAEVVMVYESQLGRDVLNKKLIELYRYARPSDDITAMFNYSWSRIYSFNIDDSLQAASKESVQRTTFYNGMIDKVESSNSLENLQIVNLHGDVSKIDHGLIMSQSDYTKSIQMNNHEWYRKLAEDYRGFTPVFVGSVLDEPILDLELMKAGRDGVGEAGAAFLVNPDDFSNVKKMALASKGIVHCKAAFSDFIRWLNDNVGISLSPDQIMTSDKGFGSENIDSFTKEDIAAAHHIFPISKEKFLGRLQGDSDSTKAKAASNFLLGFPPTWPLVAADIPVELSSLPTLRQKILQSFEKGSELFVTTGQAGSGKTTATMQALLSIANDRSLEIEVYEFSSETESAVKCINVLGKISAHPKIVYLPDLFVFGASLKEVFSDAQRAGVMFVSTARSGEWQDHFSRHFTDASKFAFERFDGADHEPIIDKLNKFVAAPAFRKLKRDDQIAKLKRSKSQLLIALREVTESRNFDDIIFDEFEKMPDEDVKSLFSIVGLSTLGRVGIRSEVAAEAYDSKPRKRSFESAMLSLEGIVTENASGRLVARHEIYVRRIFDKFISLESLLFTFTSILDTYLKYEIPAMNHVSRPDGVLLRFLLNHRVIRERAEHGGRADFGLDIYNKYEVPLQLEGHFWLQYGLYYANLGNQESAIELLEKSIQAYPNNPFTIHALAGLKLRFASSQGKSHPRSQQYVREAVKELEYLDGNSQIRLDHYPLVTLSISHTKYLLDNEGEKKAKIKAREYFERLKILQSAINSIEIDKSITTLLKFIATNEWDSHMLYSIPS